MHKQPNSIFIGDENEACIVQCHCGMGHYHGQLEFYHVEEWDTLGGYFPERNYVGVAMPPYQGTSKWNRLIHRIDIAWKVLTGKRLEYDFEIAPATSKRLAQWLIDSADGVK